MHYVTTSRLNPRRRRDGRANGSHTAGTGDRATPDNHSIHDGVGGGGGGGNGTGTASPGSSGSQLRLRLPQLEDMVAWALCLMMEVASVQLTAIALRMKREEAIRAATQAVKDVDGSRHASASAGGAGGGGGAGGAGGGDNIRTGTSTTHHDDDESEFPPSGNNHIAVTSLPQHAFDRELSRRRMALFYYLVRSPVFDRYYLAPTYLL